MKNTFKKIALTFGATGLLTLSGAALAKTSFKLTSPDIAPNKAFPMKHMLNQMGCTGENLSPAFNWSGAPEGTKSFVLTVFDKDAPTGSGWWHWVVYNIPADANGLPAGIGAGATLPAGAVEGRVDGGAPHYGGPCPPVGQTHRYVFTLHALKVASLPVPPDASPAMVGMMTTMNRLDKASFMVKVKR